MAKGIERMAELQTLRSLGIRWCQDYLLVRPAVEAFPAVDVL